jgi:bis(5'-nucleosyl)-tetraphosphatase (symmetrical)
MATYLIGDVQGCYQELIDLLKLINFDPSLDRLGFAGDLVNRGPESLEVLRFVKALQDPIVVLGNHDLFLLAIGYELAEHRHPHTLDAVLAAPDKLELLDWLRQQPLLYHDPALNYLLSHAGLPPQWELSEALSYANEVHKYLTGANYIKLIGQMFGNTPACWDYKLSGMARLRYIINCFTRMRLCTPQGCLDFKSKGRVSESSTAYQPWFTQLNRQQYANHDIIFGHWAALEGKVEVPYVYALDTGCAWGNSLTALRIEDKQRFSVPYRGKKT